MAWILETGRFSWFTKGSEKFLDRYPTITYSREGKSMDNPNAVTTDAWGVYEGNELQIARLAHALPRWFLLLPLLLSVGLGELRASLSAEYLYGRVISPSCSPVHTHWGDSR